MKKWLILSTFALGILAMIPTVAQADQRYTPYRQDNRPVSKFYDPAPALTGDYYNKKQAQPSVTTNRDDTNRMQQRDDRKKAMEDRRNQRDMDRQTKDKMNKMEQDARRDFRSMDRDVQGNIRDAQRDLRGNLPNPQSRPR